MDRYLVQGSISWHKLGVTYWWGEFYDPIHEPHHISTRHKGGGPEGETTTASERVSPFRADTGAACELELAGLIPAGARIYKIAPKTYLKQVGW